jgi:hypothetical protein
VSDEEGRLVYIQNLDIQFAASDIVVPCSLYLFGCQEAQAAFCSLLYFLA